MAEESRRPIRADEPCDPLNPKRKLEKLTKPFCQTDISFLPGWGGLGLGWGGGGGREYRMTSRSNSMSFLCSLEVVQVSGRTALQMHF